MVVAAKSFGENLHFSPPPPPSPSKGFFFSSNWELGKVHFLPRSPDCISPPRENSLVSLKVGRVQRDLAEWHGGWSVSSSVSRTGPHPLSVISHSRSQVKNLPLFPFSPQVFALRFSSPPAVSNPVDFLFPSSTVQPPLAPRS